MTLWIGWLLAFGPMRSPSPGVPNATPDDLEGMEVVERVGTTIPLNVRLRDSAGNTWTLKRLFSKHKPVVLTFAYYSCDMLCPLVLDGVGEALRGVGLRPGEDFLLLTVSVDPEDTPRRAQEVSKRYRKGLVSPEGWVFAVGDSAEVRRLARSVGFPYRKVQDDPVMYAHPALAIVLTPEGRVARYLYGISFSPSDLRLALIEAGEGRVGGLTDRILLYCYRFDPDRGRYTLVAWRVMQLVGGGTTLLVGMLLAGLWYREKRRHRHGPS